MRFSFSEREDDDSGFQSWTKRRRRARPVARQPRRASGGALQGTQFRNSARAVYIQTVDRWPSGLALVFPVLVHACMLLFCRVSLVFLSQLRYETPGHGQLGTVSVNLATRSRFWTSEQTTSTKCFNNRACLSRHAYMVYICYSNKTCAQLLIVRLTSDAKDIQRSL